MKNMEEEYKVVNLHVWDLLFARRCKSIHFHIYLSYHLG